MYIIYKYKIKKTFDFVKSIYMKVHWIFVQYKTWKPLEKGCPHFFVLGSTQRSTKRKINK